MGPTGQRPILPSSPQSATISWPQQIVYRIRNGTMGEVGISSLYAVGFLINSIAMSVLFALLESDWDYAFAVLIDPSHRLPNDECKLPNLIHTYGIRSAFPFFAIMSFFGLGLVLFLLFSTTHKTPHSYQIVSLLSAMSFLFSAVLIVAAFWLIMSGSAEHCTQIAQHSTELRTRFLLQSVAAFLTNTLYLTVGYTLSSRNRRVTETNQPTTPIYHISPPEFDTLYSPPPPYQRTLNEGSHSTNQS